MLGFMIFIASTYWQNVWPIIQYHSALFLSGGTNDLHRIDTINKIFAKSFSFASSAERNIGGADQANINGYCFIAAQPCHLPVLQNT